MVVVAVFICILEHLLAVVQAVGGIFLANVLPPCAAIAAVAQQVGNLAVFEIGRVFVCCVWPAIRVEAVLVATAWR